MTLGGGDDDDRLAAAASYIFLSCLKLAEEPPLLGCFSTLFLRYFVVSAFRVTVSDGPYPKYGRHIDGGCQYFFVTRVLTLECCVLCRVS